MVKKKTKRNRKNVGNPNRRARKGSSGRVNSILAGFNLSRFSNDLLTVRNAHGLTQRALAAKTGVTHAAIVFIERGKSSPLVENFAKLVQYLRLKPEDYIDVPKGPIKI